MNLKSCTLARICVISIVYSGTEIAYFDLYTLGLKLCTIVNNCVLLHSNRVLFDVNCVLLLVYTANRFVYYLLLDILCTFESYCEKQSNIWNCVCHQVSIS